MNFWDVLRFFQIFGFLDHFWQFFDFFGFLWFFESFLDFWVFFWIFWIFFGFLDFLDIFWILWFFEIFFLNFFVFYFWNPWGKVMERRGRVAEKSYPSYPDCIQIEISASNWMPKFTHFLSQNGQCCILRLSCITFSLLTKIYCKLYQIIGCSLKVLHAALFDAGKLVPVLDAAITSASKAFQVLTIIVINQKYWS